MADHDVPSRSDPDHPVPSRLDTGWFPWAVVGGVVVAGFLLGGLVALQVAAEHRSNPPSCSGIGFGCELDPWSTAALLGVFFYAPFVAGIAAVVGVLQLVVPRRRRATSIVALVAGCALVTVALALVLAGLASDV